MSDVSAQEYEAKSTACASMAWEVDRFERGKADALAFAPGAGDP